ncbi:hypothetical protein Pint_17031 [Pistacia integerrima]|uniref:Uncharacterized protein n=1 Tax=Pistacia integerrima TaxID=434235 RepID=A0ACC0ZFV0_9ROSI|nr:hypothetical protein Pint_17031 [Pistacia integerrima]
MVNVVAQCEGVLYGNGCETKKCNRDCIAKYGSKAYGLCFFYKKPSDTCICRHPCGSETLN